MVLSQNFSVGSDKTKVGTAYAKLMCARTHASEAAILMASMVKLAGPTIRIRTAGGE